MSFASSIYKNDPLFAGIAEIRTVFDAMQVMRKACKAHGFSVFSIITIPASGPLPGDSLAKMSIISSWPPDLIAEYDRLGLAKQSPILESVRNQIAPLVFHFDEISYGNTPEERTKVNDLFKQFNLTMGVYFPVHDVRGLRNAISFMGDRSVPTVAELSGLSLFSSLMIEQLGAVTGDSGNQRNQLTAREVEVLQWTAEGKTSAEIAVIMGLSEHTVNHYATLATQKLGCANRTQAVVYAMRLGFFN